MRYAIAIVLAAACSARLGDAIGSHTGIDSSVDGVPVDAMPDARSCTAGDANMTDAEGNCFMLFKTAKTFGQAKAACVGINAHLAKIASATENELVATMGSGYDMFLGATDAVTEGTFLWQDNTPLTFTKFHVGEPNNGGSGGYQEDCLVMAGLRTPSDTWDDRPCTTGLAPVPSGSYAYVCEF
ncbi:hypothetical protein BH11MYX1_BH11MYX1_06050 [soil metagenome]